ncbi:MAG TPA: hypothetical protein VJO16_00830 [Candidatus Acidoferrum sp.]|nr:hypothetical protein [Candidatus Acidoferrum sp.]
MVRQIIFAGLVVVLPVSLQAQGRGAMAPSFHAAAVAPRAVVTAPHAGAGTVVSGPRPVVRGGVPRSRVPMPVPRNTRPAGTRNHFIRNDFGLRADCAAAPGLGFDAVHQAAVCGSIGVGSRFRRQQVPLFFPFFDGGFFLPGSAAPVEEGSETESAQAEIVDSENRDRGRRYRVAEPQAAPPVVEAANAGPADNEEFVFVRRDGTVFFAVAYSWEKGTLRYVTSQGLRHTVTQDALDLDATRQFNEQRGLNFRLPA